MKKDSTCRISSTNKKRLKFAMKYMKMKNDQMDIFYSEDYVIGKLLVKYFRDVDINDPEETDINHSTIKITDSYLRKNRIDTNIPDNMKEDLKALSEALLKQKMVDKRLSYYEVIKILFKKYLQDYPELNNHLLEYKYLKQKLGMEKLQKQKQDERISGLK